MTLSTSAALSILIPINIENKDIAPGSPDSICSVDIQSDNENDHEVAEKRLSHYFPETPVKIGAVIKPQFSCPDFAMGTARGMKGRMKETPPAVPSISSIHVRKIEGTVETSPTGDHTSPSPRRRVRQMNNFVELDSVKRGWEDSFGEEKMAPRKRHGMFFGRLQRFDPVLCRTQIDLKIESRTTESTSAVPFPYLFRRTLQTGITLFPTISIQGGT